MSDRIVWEAEVSYDLPMPMDNTKGAGSYDGSEDLVEEQETKGFQIKKPVRKKKSDTLLW